MVDSGELGGGPNERVDVPDGGRPLGVLAMTFLAMLLRLDLLLDEEEVDLMAPELEEEDEDELDCSVEMREIESEKAESLSGESVR